MAYLSLLWLYLVTHFITRAMPIDDIDGKSHKTELKSSHNYSTNCVKSKSHHYLFMALGVYTHTHTHTHTLADKSDYKKPAGRRMPGLAIFITLLTSYNVSKSVSYHFHKIC